MTETLTSPVQAPVQAPVQLPAPMTAPTTPVQLRGLPLLDLVISQIELSPTTWNQEEWRCETGMCVAGWTAHLAGGTWIGEADDVHATFLHVEEGDSEYDVEHLHVGHTREDRTCVDGIGAADRAIRLLGLDRYTASRLFAATNTLADIKMWRDAIAAGDL